MALPSGAGVATERRAWCYPPVLYIQIWSQSSIFTSFVLCSLFVLFVVAGVLAVLPERLLRQCASWRSEILAGVWACSGLLALAGAAGRLEGGVSWFPVFGMDGPALPMLVLLAFTGGLMGVGPRGLACALTGLAFLALSPLVFGLLAGTALVLLADRGQQGVCLPFAVLPACIPADSPLSPPSLCLMVLLLGWAVSSQKGPEAVLPAGIGLFLLGRLLAEAGVLPPVQQALLIVSGGAVALWGAVQAVRSPKAASILSGVATAGYGGMVVMLTLALAVSVKGGDLFRTATLLATGTPFLALLAALWLSRQDGGLFAPQSAVAQARGGRSALGVSLALLSAVPPMGGFAVFWCLLGAGEGAAANTHPAQALCLLLVLTGAACVMALGMIGLLRVGLMAFVQTQEEPRALSPVLLLPAWICAGCAVVVTVLPGGWLALVDHLFAGDTPHAFAWGMLGSVGFAGSDISLTPLFSALALGVCVAGAGLLGRAFGVFPLRPAVSGAAEWREGAPVVAYDGEPPALPAAAAGVPVIWVAFGMLLGVGGQKPSEWPVVEKTGAGARYLQAVLFRTVAWCEAQGMVLILLFLGAGLLLGLFAAR
ncbi:hypothetical protein OQ252_00960 [Acetobacter farinalis]|uniref:NADH:quinone oxidoreductase/Mrp antiporter membrane subunit domain-containing protein n=1 Tax=Acetobacter farinalis TaxID=1260984 RepID=A0ABT3Q3V6_9PROT|nr:hypothetical protein [Acetobacter farinalis]